MVVEPTVLDSETMAEVVIGTGPPAPAPEPEAPDPLAPPAPPPTMPPPW
jgi:hypothetical protein